MFNLLSYKGNANQTTLRFHLTPTRMGNHQENKFQMPVRMQGKKQLLYTIGRMYISATTIEINIGFHS
jgi:hypothetical protein